MLTTLRNLFNAVSLRERALLAAFLWLCVLVWAASALTDFHDTKGSLAKVSRDLQQQDLWFDKKEQTESELAEVLNRLDATKTYASFQLVGKLDAIARRSKMSFDISSPSTKTGDTFDIHTVRIQFKKAGIAELISFDEEVRRESPYLGFERVQLVANKSDPRLLNAQFVVSSFESKEETL